MARFRTNAVPLRRSIPWTRRGSVLVAVLVVVVLMSLAAYQYTDVMTAQHKHSDTLMRRHQCQLLCESGVNYVSALLSNPQNISGLLSGNPYYNTEYFQDQVVVSDPMPRRNGKFSIIAPGTMPGDVAGTQGPVFGVCDEGGKINLNAVMRLDPSGNTLYNLLMQLPNMTDDIANAIIDWIDPDDNPRPSTVGGMGGAESSYYQGLSPPYSCKNNFIDSLEELLLVRGVTADLLYGNDVNRNGVQDENEMSSDGTFWAGWAAYLTVYSRETNNSSAGTPRVYLNEPDLPTLATNLQTSTLSADLQTFILIYRIYGSSGTASTTPSTSTTVTMANGMGGLSAGSLNLSTVSGKSQISSLYSLVNATVDVPSTTQGGKATRYTSPLFAALTSGSTDLTTLLDVCTIYQYSEIQGRINVNTASPTVLATLQGVVTSLQASDIQNIINAQPQYLSNNASVDASYGSPAWLMTKAGLSVATMQQLEKYVTTTSQVYSFNVLGYFDEGKTVMRYEAVVDMNFIYSNNTVTGMPRILHQRDISELGSGWDPRGNNWGGGGGGGGSGQ
jgi:type II secretory pathway component PulK